MRQTSCKGCLVNWKFDKVDIRTDIRFSSLNKFYLLRILKRINV